MPQYPYWMLNFSLNQDINYPCWVNIKPFSRCYYWLFLCRWRCWWRSAVVPTLAGIWLPLGTRIALDESPRITRKVNHSRSPLSGGRLSACAYHQRQPFTSQPLVIERRHGRNLILLVWRNCRRRSNRQLLQKPSRSGSPCCLTPGSISINWFFLPGRNGRENSLSH